MVRRNDFEMQRNAEIGLFTPPSVLTLRIDKTQRKIRESLKEIDSGSLWGQRGVSSLKVMPAIMEVSVFKFR